MVKSGVHLTQRKIQLKLKFFKSDFLKKNMQSKILMSSKESCLDHEEATAVIEA